MAVRKSAKLHSNTHLTLVVGTDELRVKAAAQEWAKKLADPDAGDFGNDIIEGVAENAEHCAQIVRQVLDALQTLPFFGTKMVWLKNVNFMADSVVGRSNAAIDGMEAILDYAETLPPEIKFLISATAVDKRRSSWKRLNKIAEVVLHDKVDTSKTGWENEVMGQVQRQASELGLRFDAPALELFVNLAGEDSRQLENELEKLSLYLGGNARVTEADVQTMVPLNRAGVIFELGNAIGRRDLRRALELVRTLIYQGQNPIGILLAAVVPRVRNLLLAADLLKRHPKLPRSSYSSFSSALERLSPDEVAHLARKKDGSGINAYPLFLALNEASRFSAKELRDALKGCAEANLKLVSTQLDAQLVLERLLVGMLTRHTSS